MPYFKINADKKPYRLSSIDKDDRNFGTYIIYARRWEEHMKNTWIGKRLVGRECHYTFAVPSPKKKLDIKFDNTVYSCKKADPMTVGRLVNHLQTLLDLENI
jgi:hypothetical protein